MASADRGQRVFPGSVRALMKGFSWTAPPPAWRWLCSRCAIHTSGNARLLGDLALRLRLMPPRPYRISITALSRRVRHFAKRLSAHASDPELRRGDRSSRVPRISISDISFPLYPRRWGRSAILRFFVFCWSAAPSAPRFRCIWRHRSPAASPFWAEMN